LAFRQDADDSNLFENIEMAINNMPTNKTSNLDEYEKYLLHFSEHIDEILLFNTVNSSLKSKFNIYKRKKTVNN